MSEEMKKNEIRDDELNAVSGGAASAREKKYCPNCGSEMALALGFADGSLVATNYCCESCGHKEKA